MNTSPITLIAPGVVTTIRPLTETVGEVLEIVGTPSKFIAYEVGDPVTLPEWFMPVANCDKGESYWQAACKPNLKNSAGETIVTPYHLENLGFWDVEVGEPA